VHAELQPADTLHAPDTPLPPDALEVDERPWLCVRVRDHGRGMSADEVALCFGKGQAASKAAGGGTGLGLYLSRAFAELVGGTLRVASRALAAAACSSCASPCAC
jgi:signal transduction histidine kinase